MKMRSLFWSIFSTIVLVNLAMVIANAYWFGVQLEKRNIKERFSENLDEHMIRLVDEYEERAIGRSDHRPAHMQPIHMPKHLIRQFHLEIIDLASDRPLWPSPRPVGQSESVRQTKQITSSSGRAYKVIYLDEPELVSPFWEILSRFGLSRWIITITFSIAGSFILSFIIILPLKKLIRHTQNLANGDLATRVEARLEKRQDEIGVLSQTFNEMAERIQHLIETQQALLHDVSHELRAPLQRLQVNVEIARDKFDSDQSAHSLFDRQQREIDKLREMIDGILELARVGHLDKTASVYDRDSKNININEELQELVAYYRGQYPSKIIEYTADDSIPDTLKLNHSLFERVLNNIVENAMKHTQENARININLETKTSSQLKTPSQLLICVSDNGPGVDAAVLHQLTQPFFRAASDHPTAGHGLGLSIASKAITALNGELKIARSYSGGLEVTIVLNMV